MKFDDIDVVLACVWGAFGVAELIIWIITNESPHHAGIYFVLSALFWRIAQIKEG